MAKTLGLSLERLRRVSKSRCQDSQGRVNVVRVAPVHVINASQTQTTESKPRVIAEMALPVGATLRIHAGASSAEIRALAASFGGQA